MRASEHDDIGMPAILLDEAGLDFRAHGILIHETLAHIGFGKLRKVAAANQANMTFRGIGTDQVARILALHCAWCRQHRNQPGAGALCRRLDRRDRADKYLLRIDLAQMIDRQGRCRIAGYDNHRGLPFPDQPAKQRRHVIEQRFFFPIAIGKRRIISNIYKAICRHQHPRLAQHRQPAYAAVEYQYCHDLRAHNLAKPGAPRNFRPQRPSNSNNSRVRANARA